MSTILQTIKTISSGKQTYVAGSRRPIPTVGIAVFSALYRKPAPWSDFQCRLPESLTDFFAREKARTRISYCAPLTKCQAANGFMSFIANRVWKMCHSLLWFIAE